MIVATLILIAILLVYIVAGSIAYHWVYNNTFADTGDAFLIGVFWIIIIPIILIVYFPVKLGRSIFEFFDTLDLDDVKKDIKRFLNNQKALSKKK